VTADLASQLERRRSAVADRWRLTDEVALVAAGEPIPVPGRHDLTYPFQAHSEYYYLTDRDRPGGVLAFDPAEGWVDFVAPVTVEDRVWSGAADHPSGSVTTEALAAWLTARRGRPVAWLGSVPASVAVVDRRLSEHLRFGLSAVRRIKDPVEIDRMRLAEAATRAAYTAVVPFVREGVSEREAKIEFEAEALRHGADAMGYDSIVGGGPNSAVLHFPPTDRPFRAGELVLIDAGAAYKGYVSDVTRTYPVGRPLSGVQRELHGLVHAAEQAGVERCQAGVEWREVHHTAARVIADGLASLGVLRGEPDALVESGAVSLFFPHGVGHLVGLGVRDAGGILEERRDEPPPYPNLRINLPLQAGMVVTVEPGVYFIPALLQDPDHRRTYRDQIDWDRVDRMLDFGGIRIEDNVLVTEGGHDVLTADIPVLG
jgi:Xaa-Pro aminopeptidase